jgi:hypothetical protein
MKKLILLSVLSSSLFMSCAKTYKCHCDYKEDHAGHTHDEETEFELKYKKKADAETACESKETEINAVAGHSEAHCHLD